jgi:hypothetical protein
MENAVQLEIPLEIKLKTGLNWNDLEQFEISSNGKGMEQRVPQTMVELRVVKNLFGSE